LAYNRSENVASNFSYDGANIDDSLYDDVEVEESLDSDNSLKSLSKSNLATMTVVRGADNSEDEFKDTDVSDM
jgi:predicted nuclease of restriction endonuclease-like RecB superfamily